MSEYVKQLTGYVNNYKSSEGQYLNIKNVSDKDIVIKAGQNLFMKRTPSEILEKYPKVPHYSMNAKVELSQDNVSEEVANNIPF